MNSILIRCGLSITARCWSACAAVLVTLCWHAVAIAETVPDFATDVHPILAAKCFRCHGPEKQQSSLRLDSREIAFKGGDWGEPAVVPGNSEASLLVQLVSSDDSSVRMPLNGNPLSAAEVDLLKRWIDAGAAWPDAENVVVAREPAQHELVVTAKDREHWAFRPLSIEAPAASAHNLIDDYLAPAASSVEAAPHTLIRRLYFDIIGLPPSPQEVDSFVDDNAPDAYERLVDRVLASSHYGERWGRHWLDVARYADSDGYEADKDRPHAWPYRDWVIRALNDDLPFDTFVEWQVAGDELAPADPNAVVATGFLTAGPWHETTPADTEENKLRIRYDELDDMVATIGSAFLGLTVGCARCHDHKFDPIPTRDYYRMVAAFATAERQVASLCKPRRDFESWKERQRAAWRERQMDKLTLTDGEKFWLRQPEHFFVPIQTALYKKYGEQLKITDENLRESLSQSQRSLWDRLQHAAELADADEAAARSLIAMDIDEAPRPTFLLARGSVSNRGEKVSLGFLQVLMRGKSPAEYLSAVTPTPVEKVTNESGIFRPPTTYQRSAVATWLTDVEHGAGALVARVAMNRVWQHHFGEGFTPTPNDVGFQSPSPNRPELLERLASDFVRGGWRLKRIHKLICMSAAYRAAGQQRDFSEEAPIGRRSMRLEPEILRDTMLAISGRLNLKQFGPPFRPIIPAEAIATRSSDAYPTNITDGPEIRRRSVYAFTKRSVPNPLMEVFDAPDPGASCGRRNVTTVPTQALVLMNNDSVRDCAKHFAVRVANLAGSDRRARVEVAYRLALARPPTEAELQRSLQFLAAVGASSSNENPADQLIDFCHVLFTLNEFAYVD